MKKLILTLLAAAVCTALTAQIKIDPNSFFDIESNNVGVSAHDLGVTNMTTRSIDWPIDADGGNDVALLIIRFVNVPLSEYIRFNIADTTVPMPATDQKAVFEENGIHSLKVFIPAHKGADINISHPEYGPARLTNKDIEPHHIYRVTVENNKLVNIHIDSNPKGASIYLDGKDMHKNTPADINNVTLGIHELSLIPVGSMARTANELHNKRIEVTDSKLSFYEDLLKTKQVTIVSKPDGARLRIIKTGEIIATGTSPMQVRLPYGEITIAAELPNGAYNEAAFTINNATTDKIEVSINKSREITINAVQNNQPVNGANVNIDGEYMGLVGRAYKLDYGTHNVQVTHQGYYTSKKLVVNEKTKELQTFKLPNRQRYAHTWNPFDEDYNKREWGLAFNYINRCWVFRVNDARRKYDMWDREGKTESGFQIGLAYTPYFGYGQGLVTGLYWQMFMRTMSDFNDEPMWTDNALYIPLQYQFRLPLSEDVSVYINAGIGMTIGLANELDYGDNNGGSYNLGYGTSDDGLDWPSAFQLSLPVGAGFQWKALCIDFKYSWGLNDNSNMYTIGENFEGKASYKMRTWSLGLHLMF